MLKNMHLKFKKIIASVFTKNYNIQNLFIFGHTKAIIRKSSQIQIINKLCINRAWHYSIYKSKGTFMVKDNAKLNVNDFTICEGCFVDIRENAMVTIGTGYANQNFHLFCSKGVTIGNNVAIAENVTIRDCDDHHIVGQEENAKPIVIGNNVWLGTHVIVLKGVTIGDGAIIGAGAVVVNDIPENTLAVGVPAKVIKTNVEWY